MKITLTLISFIIFNLVSYSQKKNIDLADITANVYRPKGITKVLSSADGQCYFKLSDNNTKIIKYSYKTGLAIDTIFDVSKAKGVTLTSIQGFSFSPNESEVLLYNNIKQIYRRSFVANYYLYAISDNKILKLSETNKQISSPLFSPDGKQLAYVYENNIWLYNVYTHNHKQVTKDGAINKIINGNTDWAYEEEFSVTSIMSFSDDSKFLAYVRFDETDVKQFFFQTFKDSLYTGADEFKYPKAGEANSKVSCRVYDILKQEIAEVHLPAKDVEYIPRIEFIADKELAILTLNRNQNDFRMYYYNTNNKHARLVFEEKNNTYVDCDFIQSLQFIPNGFLYMSERDGFSHIYHYKRDGSLIAQLTKGNFDVTSILGYNTKNNLLFYQAADENPMNRNIFKYDLKNKKITKLSKNKGYNTAFFSNGGEYFINDWSDLDTPNLITLNSALSGKELRVLEDNSLLQENLSEINRASQEFISVKAADGSDLNGYMIKPFDFDPSKKYPLLMVQYSGPNSQQVLNRFNIDWVQYLVNQGYLVAAVDGRGTGARGENFRKSTYLNLGIKESEDQIAAAKFFASLPYVDAKNISIWGWSFGGYNVLMALSKSSDVFNSGIAIAPVTDWRFYDSIYTERYMQTPQSNRNGYDNGSPLKLANQLEGKLLLIHGSADDNVHFQNSMEYTTQLIKNGKQFELFVFPDLNHSIVGSKNRLYLYRKNIDFLKNHFNK